VLSLVVSWQYYDCDCWMMVLLKSDIKDYELVFYCT
jgi:hypothetical protein